MKNLFFTFIILLTATRLYAIPGDLNDDGKVDIADIVRLNDMINNKLDKTPQADLNFDGNVDSADEELLSAAVVENKPLPEKLATMTFYQGAGQQSISGGGLTIDMEDFSRITTVSLATIATPPDMDWDLGNCSMTPPVIVYGLPGQPDLYDASFTLDVPATHNDKAGKPMLLLGFYGKSPHQTEPQWNYRALPAEEEFDITYANHKLIWKPNYNLTYQQEVVPFCMAVLYSTKAARTASLDSKKTRAGDFQFEKADYLYGYGIYRTKHFCIELHTSVAEATVKAFARELEDSYKKIGDLGMPQDFSKKWVTAKRIWVNINKNPLSWKLKRVKSDTAGCQAPSMLKAPYIDVPEGAMDSNQRAETCCHELFHYHQYYYAVHATALFLDEMVGNWSEYLVTSDPNNYRPNNYLEPRAVINGLYRASWAESMINGKHYAGDHGYCLVPFARWLTEIKYPKKKLWPSVFSSRSYILGDGMSAIKTAIKEMESTDTLATIYPEFMRDYFAETSGIPYIGSVHELFKQTSPAVLQAPIDRFDKTGMLTLITKPSDMFKSENQKHTFSVQNFGGATWRYMFKEPNDYLTDYTNAVVTFSLPENSTDPITDFKFFAVIFNGFKTTLTEWESVTVNSENNTAKMVIPLEDMAPEERHFTYIGLVAVYANDFNPPDYTQALTMSVDFAGPIVANDLVAWIGDYNDQQDARATGDLTITPVNDTLFSGAKFDVHSLNNKFRCPDVYTNLGGDRNQRDIMFNITGVIKDATASIEAPSKVWRSEYTGKVMFDVGKTTMDNEWHSVDHEELLFDGKNYTKLTNYTPELGNGAKVSDLLPVEPGKQSKFYLRIPNINHTAALYSITIQLPYREYEIGEKDSMDIRHVYILNFVIYIAVKK